ncbi:MAG: hypothetical protein JWR63_1746 [Conexibacter sp.]|nr:hypothetical protein [Conexibacter sp.]
MKRIKITLPGDNKTHVSDWLEDADADQALAVIQHAMANNELVDLPWYAGEAHHITGASLQIRPTMPAPAVGRGMSRRGLGR